MRFHSADASWHIFAFAGKEHPMSDDCRVKALCNFLQTDHMSPIKLHTPQGADRANMV
ncbi:hypothetical protein [Neptunomonas antarctica]|nr:hypothetical protein [Neptunomonas antarctica]